MKVGKIASTGLAVVALGGLGGSGIHSLVTDEVKAPPGVEEFLSLKHDVKYTKVSLEEAYGNSPKSQQLREIHDKYQELINNPEFMAAVQQYIEDRNHIGDTMFSIGMVFCFLASLAYTSPSLRRYETKSRKQDSSQTTA